MRIVTAVHIAIFALMLAGTAQAQEQASPTTEPQTESQMPSAPPPSMPEAPPLAPKIQDRAQTKTEPPPPRSADSRFSFDKVSDGFVRLDGQTGQIAYCSARTVGWTCQAVPENRAALEQEMSRLQEEVAALKKEIAGLTKEIAALREPPPVPPLPTPPPAAAPATPENFTLRLPTQDELARARAYMEDTVQDTWRRLMEMISGFRKDVMRKS